MPSGTYSFPELVLGDPLLLATLTADRIHPTISTSLSAILSPDRIHTPTGTALSTTLSPDRIYPTIGTPPGCIGATTANEPPRNSGLLYTSHPPNRQGSTFVFDSAMEPLQPKRLPRRSQADKDAALKLKQMGGACQKHRASKKKANQVLTKHRLTLTLRLVSLSFAVCGNRGNSCSQNCFHRYCYPNCTQTGSEIYRSWPWPSS
jgi:hypothetical protein